MSQKSYKAIRKAALKYARKEEKAIAMSQMRELYSFPFRYRLMAALGILFKWGNDGSLKGRNRHGYRETIKITKAR